MILIITKKDTTDGTLVAKVFVAENEPEWPFEKGGRSLAPCIYAVSLDQVESYRWKNSQPQTIWHAGEEWFDRTQRQPNFVSEARTQVSGAGQINAPDL